MTLVQGFVEPENHEIFFHLAEGGVFQKLPDELADEREVRRMTGELDFAFHGISTTARREGWPHETGGTLRGVEMAAAAAVHAAWGCTKCADVVGGDSLEAKRK